MEYNTQQMGMANQDRELGWDDQIEKESQFILLPAGEYPFIITGFDRQRHAGSANLPPCNKAVLSVKVTTPKGQESVIKNTLFLHTKTESFLSAFFISIGQKKKGQPLQMNWDTVIGSTGICKVKQYQGSDGNTYNDIDKFLPPKENIPTDNMGPGGGYTPGQF